MTSRQSNFYYAVLFLAFSVLTGCTRGNEDPVYGYCVITKMYSQGDTSQTATNYLYDTNDRLILWNGPGPLDNTITYESTKIVIRGVPPYTDSYTVYYIGNDSLANSSAQYLQGNRIDTTLYFYDATKYLVKSVRFTPAFGKDSVIMTYSGQNLSKIIIYNSNGTTPQATFEYTADLSKSWVYQNIGPYNNNGIYLPWLGKSNRNLIKSYSSDFNGNPQPVTISYGFNASGFVDNFNMTHLGNSQKTFFEYHCR